MSSTVSLLAFSDPHRDLRAAQEILEASGRADVIVGAGDFGDRGVGALDTLSVLSQADCPIVIVSGNHDRVTELSALCASHDHMHLLHGDAVTLAGVRFVGIGSAIAYAEPSPNSEWMHEDEAHARLCAHSACDVLISHTPPRGVADIHPDGSSGGSDAVRDAVTRLQPELCLCGHVHRSHGGSGLIGSTQVQNLGPTLWRFELVR